MAIHRAEVKEAGWNEWAVSEAAQQALSRLPEIAEPAELATAERERLLLAHLPTVRYVARRIHERLPQHVELEDLVSAGIVGLIDAFEKFSPSKQVQFKSYAQFRIRGAILDSLRMLDWSPRELRRKGRAMEEAMRALTQRLGRVPSEPEIAAEMQMGLDELQQLMGELKGLEIGSLHMERNEDAGDEEIAYIPTSPKEDPLFQCLQGEMRQRLIDAIEELPEKERMVLTLYYYEEAVDEGDRSHAGCGGIARVADSYGGSGAAALGDGCFHRRREDCPAARTLIL